MTSPKKMTASQKKQKRRYYLFLLLLLLHIVLAVLILDVLFILIPDKDTSATENRNLQKFPKVTFTTLTDGSFEEDFESYIADQFPFRNKWISLETTVSRFMGKKESNGIYLARGGYLIQNFTQESDENYKKMIQGITAVSKINPDIKTRVLAAPTAVSVYSKKLPAGAPAGDETAFINKLSKDMEKNGIEFIDVRGKFADVDRSEQLYYRTDHHWTTYAAYIAYKHYAKAAGISDSTRYTPKLVSDSFKGTLSASSGFRPGETDKIYIYEPEQATEYAVHNLSDSTAQPSVYYTDNLKTRDQYALFFNGNYPEIEIDTGSSSDRVLLLFKDSYANCFAPFLIPDYKRIIMVDPRYYTEDVTTLIESQGITDILFLYNADTLASDTNISQLVSE